MFKCPQIMCAKYYKLWCMFKQFHIIIVGACL